MNMKMILSNVESPLGTMPLATDEQHRVRALEFAERRSRLHRNLREQYGAHDLIEGPAPAVVADALQRYFAGELRALDSIEVATAGTELQERAWAALRHIPAGQTTTYGALGKSVGINDWRAAVDMGAAVGANPIAIIVPCHRVLGVNGDLKGYAWGPHRKRWLLEHEASIDARPADPQTGLQF
jgi:methylated-DNA-[protein]-cysteine S-methyltransferase